MNLARPFKAGKAWRGGPRRVATLEKGGVDFNRRYATRTGNDRIPELKRRAKFTPTLRVENKPTGATKWIREKEGRLWQA